MSKVGGIIDKVYDSHVLSDKDVGQLASIAFALNAEPAATKQVTDFFVAVGQGDPFNAPDGKPVNVSQKASDALFPAYENDVAKPHSLEMPQGSGMTFATGLPRGTMQAHVAMQTALLGSLTKSFGGKEGELWPDKPEDLMKAMRFVQLGGTAAEDYTLKFKLLETAVEVPIKAGDSNKVAAQKVADAINAARPEIQKSPLASNTFFTADDATVHGPFAAANGGVVAIVPSVVD